MSTNRMLPQWAGSIKSLYKSDIISSKWFSPWYSRKTADLTLSNNHSLLRHNVYVIFLIHNVYVIFLRHNVYVIFLRHNVYVIFSLLRHNVYVIFLRHNVYVIFLRHNVYVIFLIHNVYVIFLTILGVNKQ
jgi:hypothetical protein